MHSPSKMPYFCQQSQDFHQNPTYSSVNTPYKTGLGAVGSDQNLRCVSARLQLGCSNSRHFLSLFKEACITFYFIYVHHSKRSRNRVNPLLFNELLLTSSWLHSWTLHSVRMGFDSVLGSHSEKEHQPYWSSALSLKPKMLPFLRYLQNKILQYSYNH